MLRYADGCFRGALREVVTCLLNLHQVSREMFRDKLLMTIMRIDKPLQGLSRVNPGLGQVRFSLLVGEQSRKLLLQLARLLHEGLLSLLQGFQSSLECGRAIALDPC